jgi:hypothetical protein
MLPDVAVIVVDPAPREVASPCEPIALEMNATEPFEELHVTVDVRFCVVPSDNIPVAMNCSVMPMMMVGLDGVTVIATSTGAVTVSIAEFEVTPEKAAVIVVVPVARDVASPLVPAALLTVAICMFDDIQVAAAVRFCVVPSE